MRDRKSDWDAPFDVIQVLVDDFERRAPVHALFHPMGKHARLDCLVVTTTSAPEQGFVCAETTNQFNPPRAFFPVASNAGLVTALAARRKRGEAFAPVANFS